MIVYSGDFSTQWQYSRTRSWLYSVEEIDTWPESDEKHHFKNPPKSALWVALQHRNAEMIVHPVLNLVLRIKWELFARRWFLVEFILTLLLMLTLLFAVALLPTDISSIIPQSTNITDLSLDQIEQAEWELRRYCKVTQ